MFHELSKEELFAVMKNLVHIYSSAWFKSQRIIIEKHGLNDFFSQDFNELFRNFGANEAKKLVELSVVKGGDIDSIIKAFRLSHWALFENVDLKKLNDNVARMRIIDCSRQKYAIKKWGTYYPCKDLNFSRESRVGFVKAINPKAEVKCNFCPPDPRPPEIPKNVSCEWIITAY
ncbi:MAG: DUF6125 family protein [Candidatus Bathyarchaeia archaeon]